MGLRLCPPQAMPAARPRGAASLAAFAALVPICGAFGLPCAQNHDSFKARELLAKSLRRAFDVNVVAIIMQRDATDPGTFQRVKVERAADGRTHHTILQPLRLQGVESVDDGDRMRVFLPDRRMMIDQDSPQHDFPDLSKRMKLASKNYTFRIEGKPVVAGRQAWTVEAVPRHDEMDVRRYVIDEKTGYPLRLETISGEGKRKLFFDTKEIQYPENVDERVFTLRPLGGVKLIRYDKPKFMASASECASYVGFTPVEPESLPFGFIVQEVQYNETPDWRSIATRLTDGLARATVYQWRLTSKEVQVSSLEDSTVLDRDGVRFMIVSDLSPSIRERLLLSFAGRAEVDPFEFCAMKVPSGAWAVAFCSELPGGADLLKPLKAFNGVAVQPISKKCANVPRW